MKAAFSTWNNRIAPVFDASNQIFLVEVESGNIVQQQQEILPNDLPVQAALRLAEIKADVLVCGAISRGLHAIISSYGIRIIPFVAGDLSEVVQAWISGHTDWARFAMPGCLGGGRRRFGRSSSNFQDRFSLTGQGPGCRGSGSGMRNSENFRTQPGGYENKWKIVAAGHCVCPKCGFRKPHQRGVPCSNIHCPTCGTPLIRQ